MASFWEEINSITMSYHEITWFCDKFRDKVQRSYTSLGDLSDRLLPADVFSSKILIYFDGIIFVGKGGGFIFGILWHVRKSICYVTLLSTSTCPSLRNILFICSVYEAEYILLWTMFTLEFFLNFESVNNCFLDQQYGVFQSHKIIWS